MGYMGQICFSGSENNENVQKCSVLVQVLRRKGQKKGEIKDR